MKKKYLLLAGVLALCLAFSGCGDKDKKDGADDKNQTVDIQEGPEQDDSDVVTMQKNENTIDKSKISKFLGTKSENSGEVVITNETGREISEFYMRPTPTSDENSDEDYEGDSWGGDLIQENFTLKDKEMALLYYDKDNKDSNGSQIKNYDLQVAFKDMDISENCFFRNLDLTVTDNITLYIDDGIPYVKYFNNNTKREENTLAAAKKRMGIEDDDQDATDTPEATETPEATATPEPTETPDVTATPEPPEEGDSAKDKAAQYIGKTLDQMTSDPEVGSPEDSDYDVDPGTGNEVGYHYYNGFTVYTIRNEDGSESVTGVS